MARFSGCREVQHQLETALLWRAKAGSPGALPQFPPGARGADRERFGARERSAGFGREPAREFARATEHGTLKKGD